MGSYLVRRFLLMVLTLFGMSVLIFVMLRLVPGNIADILVDAAGIADPKEKAKIAHELGLPVKLIGVGEGVDDLRPFDPRDFARALVAD